MPHDETLSQIAEAFHSNAALDLAATMQAPEVDEDVSEATLHRYARTASRSVGRRKYSEHMLVTGSDGRRPSRADYAEMSEPADHVDRANFDKCFANTAARYLQRKAVEAGFDIDAIRNGDLVELARLEDWCTERKLSTDEV